jgi:signal transduction histidine kinase
VSEPTPPPPAPPHAGAAAAGGRADPGGGAGDDAGAAGPGRPRSWVEPALVVGFWTVMAVLTALGHALDPRANRWRLQPVVPGASVGLAFAASYLWAALTPLIFRLSGRYGVERARWRSRAAALLAVGVLVAVGVEMATAYLRFEVFFERRAPAWRFDPLYGMVRLAWLDDLIVYFAVLAAGFARDYFRRLQARHAEAVRLQADAARFQAEAARLEAQLADARLTALRAQLDPHFLFNTLNAVSSLVGSDPRGVRRMIARLSALLRHTLEESSEPEVPLERELGVLAQYVEIMEIRFEGRLHVETAVDPGALDALVPPLILQPLVENAIQHGVGRLPSACAGRVAVSARRDGDVVVLTVRDNGPALDDASALARAGGVGLRNTRARLAQLYGPDHTCALAPAPGGGVVAEVTLPYHTRADLHATAADGGAGADADAAPSAEPAAAARA